MKHLCAWCNQTIGPDTGSDDTAVTHGICMTCVTNFFGSETKALTTFLSELNAPVLIVNESGEVLAGNPSALAMTNKQIDEALAQRIGEVTDCVFSSLPEGCGRTVHCKGCSIRRAVEQTHLTGQPQNDVPAFQNVNADGETIRMNYLISTLVHNGVILVRIDEATPEA